MGKCRSDCVSLFARRTIGNIANRVDYLMGRTGRDDHLAPRKRLFAGVEQGLYGCYDLQRFGHSAFTGLAALGHLTPVWANEMHPVFPERPGVALCGRVLPHVGVHGRCHENGLVGGKQHRRGEIIGLTGGELGHQVGGRGCDDKKVGLARKTDMADIVFVLTVEQIGEDMVRRECAHGKRRDELLCGPCHHTAHACPALAQAADQVEAFIGCDAPADQKQDARFAKGLLRGCHRCRLSYDGFMAGSISV